MTFTKYLRANREAPLTMLLWQGAFLLLGVCMVLGINATLNNAGDYTCMGALFVLLATVVGVMVRGQTSGATRFQLVMSMGLTRREYLLYDPMVTALLGAMGLTVSWCVYYMENWQYQRIYPGAVDELELSGLFQPAIMLLLLAGLVLLDLLFTALTLRFGFGGFRMVWVTCCLSCVVVPNAISAYREGGGSLFAKLGWLLCTVAGLLPLKLWLVVGIALLLALLAVAVRVFKKAEVRL